MENEQLIREINKNMSTVLPDEISLHELNIRLSAFINQLILTDFEKLIQLLYRIDVSEHRLKQLLQQNHQEEAGKLIAALIIERQIEKIKTRQQFNQQEDNLSGEEKW